MSPRMIVVAGPPGSGKSSSFPVSSNLPKAIAEMDELCVYDNSPVGGPPKLVLESEKGVTRFCRRTHQIGSQLP